MQKYINETMSYEQMKKELQKDLPEVRYQHTLGVASTAVLLAQAYGADEQQAKVAGLLHDCAKCMPNEERVDYCLNHNVEVSQAERENLTLLHAKCGAILAKEKYGVQDPEILHAIQVHTTGVPAMSLLDKIIFVSDYIEPHRCKAPRLDELRKLAPNNLNLTVYYILEDTVHHLNQRNAAVDPTTQDAYLYYDKIRRLHSHE